MTVRVGFIGAGGIANAHLKRLSQLDNVNIIGIYDVDTERAEQAAGQVGAQAFSDTGDLVRGGRIDALFVCTPPFARGDIEEHVAKEGIHLFAEKPIGLDIATVRQKAEVLKESGVITASGYCLRYMDIVQEAKAYLQDKQVDLILSKRIGGLHTPQWWRDLERSGGQFVEQTTHQVDLIRYLAGEIVEVDARFEQRAIHHDDPSATIYDNGTVAIKLETGAIGNISNSCLSHYYGKSEVEFFGRDFYVQIDGAKLKIVDADQERTVVSRVDYVLEQDKRFIQAIESGRQEDILCSYDEGLKTLEVTLRANTSALEKLPQAVGQ